MSVSDLGNFNPWGFSNMHERNSALEILGVLAYEVLTAG